MRAEIISWGEVPPGSRVLIQGTIMKFLRELASDEDARRIEVKYKGMDMEMTVLRNDYTAVVTDDDTSPETRAVNPVHETRAVNPVPQV